MINSAPAFVVVSYVTAPNVLLIAPASKFNVSPGLRTIQPTIALPVPTLANDIEYVPKATDPLDPVGLRKVGVL
jgi:hypothetical protein